MKALLVLSLTMTLCACGSGGSGGGSDTPSRVVVNPNGGSPAIATPTPSPTPVATPSPTPVPTVSVTYYTKVHTATISTGGQTYPFTVAGHCAVYETNTYCWDSGVVDPASNGDYLSFWGFCTISGSVSTCGNGTDPMNQPRIWDNTLHNLVTQFGDDPGSVMSTGLSSTVTCAVSGTITNCGIFSIDTSQVPL